MSNKDLIDYFIAHSDARFDKIEQKVDDLLSFKWKLLGLATASSTLISVAFYILDVVK